MKIHPLHSWDVTVAEATILQRELAAQVDVRPPLKKCDLIAGADISYNRFSPTMYAAVVVLRMDDLSIVEVRGAVAETPFAYQPGYLSFREAPALIEAFARVESKPDAVMFDGQGIAHPRRLGLASHVGLWLQKPSLGCAKSRLIGRFGTLPREAGSAVPMTQGDEQLGMVVRTKTGVQPVYVSPGHLIDIASSVDLVLRSCLGYRIPEPTRQAHLHVNALRRGDVDPT
ncbi:MAG TPA: deoxyribonuclease V [Gemmataceae bacterium]|nr:deoxyribonuclease V [Gemmataceae bacterium]